MNNRLLKLIAGTFIVVFLFLLSANITFAQTSSCQHISGNGPIKIVFLKDKRLPLTLDEYNKYASYAISGFKDIDPFKQYFNKFSFYLDTKDRDGDSEKFSQAIPDSSCGNDAREYVYFDRKEKARSFYVPGGNVVYIFDEISNEKFFPTNLLIKNVTIHESGHLIGALNDEYEDSTMAPSWFLSRWINDMFSRPFTNCSSNPSSDYKNADGKLYGSIKTVGCNYQSDMYYRPSPYANVMDLTRTFETSFNVISCGYVIAGIKGESTTKSNAEKYWPECCNLDTEKTGVIGCGDTSTLNFPPPPEDCLLTDFTNQVTEVATSSDSNVIITAQQDIVLPRTEQEGFFKINGNDVSVPDGNGGKKVPSGQQLALIPPGGALNIEMSDIYCREEEIELQAEVQPINTKSPIKSVFNQSVQADCAIVAASDYNGSTGASSFSAAILKIISDVLVNYGTLIDETDLYVTPQNDSAEASGRNINSQIEDILGVRKNTKILVVAHSIAAIGAFNYPYKTANGKLSYLLYDPPYNADLILGGLLGAPTWFWGNGGEISTARSNNIASSPDVINWSDGFQNNDPATISLHTKFSTDPNALSRVKDWIIANCPVATATSSLTIDIPAQRNCIIDSFLATTTQASSSEDILISAEDDIPLDNLTADDDFNFFKINGIDVSVPADDNGGRKIPKGDLIIIPAGTEVTYETGDKYCREGDFGLSFTQVPVTLERPIICFFNCK